MRQNRTINKELLLKLIKTNEIILTINSEKSRAKFYK